MYCLSSSPATVSSIVRARFSRALGNKVRYKNGSASAREEENVAHTHTHTVHLLMFSNRGDAVYATILSARACERITSRAAQHMQAAAAATAAHLMIHLRVFARDPVHKVKQMNNEYFTMFAPLLLLLYGAFCHCITYVIMPIKFNK